MGNGISLQNRAGGARFSEYLFSRTCKTLKKLIAALQNSVSFGVGVPSFKFKRGTDYHKNLV